MTTRLPGFSASVRDVLRQYDSSGRRSLGVSEVSELVQDMKEKEAARRTYKRAALMLLILALALLAGTFGLTWVVVATLKDVKVSSDGTLMVKNNGHDVGTAELQVTKGFTSQADLLELVNMKQLLLTSDQGARVALSIQGVARLPRPQPLSIHGSVVLIITAGGTVELDGTELSFVSGLPPQLEQAGFRVRASTAAVLVLSIGGPRFDILCNA